ncbi:MAG: hypothetical protein JSU70_18505 [Phycisphaerales bacterium]|nr:MAG: hypothetical protein JSU70_18505 [Phycisphaerales bacterium]
MRWSKRALEILAVEFLSIWSAVAILMFDSQWAENERITKIGRPKMSSGEGIMAGDEGIVSVLRGDNALVRRLSLKHLEMARPLFHV